MSKPSALQRLDRFMARPFTAPKDATGIWSVIASLAGRALLLTIIVWVIFLIAAWLQGPIISVKLKTSSLQQGVVYALPLTEVAVTGSATLSSCRVVPAANGASALELAISYSLDFSEQQVADPDATYLIPAGRLQHPFLPETIDISLSPAGTLKSLGSTSASLLGAAQALSAKVAEGVRQDFPSPTSGGPALTVSEEEVCKGLPRPLDTVGGSSASVPPQPVTGRIYKRLSLGDEDKAIVPSFEVPLSQQVAKLLADKGPHAYFDRVAGIATPELKLDDSVEGVLYRYPSQGEYFACWGGCDEDTPRIIDNTVPTLARGQEAVLPIEHGWFGGRSQKLSFGDLGDLEGYESSSSTGK